MGSGWEVRKERRDAQREREGRSEAVREKQRKTCFKEKWSC